MPRLFFEDFAPGAADLPGSVTVTKDAILAYAREYDPQVFHVDEEAAKATFVGGLIASGWHSCALLMRLIADGFIIESSSMGAPGVEETQWTRPIRPGDTIRARRTVLETKASRSRPEMGLVRFRFELLNQRDEVVLSQLNWMMFGRRSALPSAGEGGPGMRAGTGAVEAGTTAPLPPPPQRAAGLSAPFFEDLAPGQTRDLGGYTFEADEIIRFAKQFDPQVFHVDPEAAKRSHFGGLCASGWHTAAVWMKLMVDFRRRAREATLARGERPRELGPSPGFKELRWLKPVYAGDTISFASTFVEKRPSASRPGWGLAFHRNTGDNQHGERVFEFTGAAFWERR